MTKTGGTKHCVKQIASAVTSLGYNQSHFGYFHTPWIFISSENSVQYIMLLLTWIFYIYVVNLRPGYRAHIDYLLVHLVVEILFIGDSDTDALIWIPE